MWQSQSCGKILSRTEKTPDACSKTGSAWHGVVVVTCWFSCVSFECYSQRTVDCRNVSVGEHVGLACCEDYMYVFDSVT
jgi:hypothetical protein